MRSVDYVLTRALCRGRTRLVWAAAVIMTMFVAGSGTAYAGASVAAQHHNSVPVEVNGRAGTLLVPSEQAEGGPWAIHAATPASDSPVVSMLLAKGFHVAFINEDGLYDCDDAATDWDALYDWVREQHGLAEKPAVLAQDHGAIPAYHWAARHPRRVACIYAQTPWLHLEAGGDSTAAFPTLRQATDADAMLAPVIHANLLGEANIPIMHFYRPQQPGRPVEKGRTEFRTAYRLAGGRVFEEAELPPSDPDARYDSMVHTTAFLLTHTDQLPGTLDGIVPGASDWKAADFSGRTAVRVLDDILILEAGNEMTGITTANEPPEGDYEIVLDAMRLSGGDFFCALTAPYKDTVFSLVVGGWGGTCVGISSLDWLDAYHNETAHFRSFEDNRWYRIRLRVTGDTIRAWIDGDEVVNIDVADREVDIRWEMAPTTPLGIATWRTSGAIKNFSLRPIAPAQ